MRSFYVHNYFVHFRHGFTLIELMVVVAVIAILATIALFGLGGVQKGARDTQRLATMNGIRSALERHNADRGSYATGGFSIMVASLTTAGYLSGLFDPGCGSGTVALTAFTMDAAGNAASCGAATWPIYSFTNTGGSGGYTLFLRKEGGAIATLRSPI